MMEMFKKMKTGRARAMREALTDYKDLMNYHMIKIVPTPVDSRHKSITLYTAF